MNINLVDKAFKKTKNYFHSFWENPVTDEEEIFYEFLIMQTFIQLQLPPTLLSDFWTQRNSELVARMDMDEYYNYGYKRDDRFKEYTKFYDVLSNSPFFRKGGTPSLSSEFSAIQDFSGAVFNYVESGYISSTDAEKNMTLASNCLSIVALQMAILYGEDF